MTAPDPEELRRLYGHRFAANLAYRRRVWEVLATEFFARWIGPADAVLDLGCGYGEFISAIRCRAKFAMDCNPGAPRHLAPEVTFLQQDCARRWELADGSLDAVFTSNFFEHLPDQQALGRTLDEARRVLVGGGRLIAMGPNIRYLPGAYWDFWDHHLPLTDRSLAEGLAAHGFEVPLRIPRFLPYTMARGPAFPPALLRLYLRLKPAWPLFGRQFLLIASKPQRANGEALAQKDQANARAVLHGDG